MNCEKCFYYHERECRRFPPFHGFPVVAVSSWCGEFKAKEIEICLVEEKSVKKEEADLDNFLESYQPKRGWPKGKPRK